VLINPLDLPNPALALAIGVDKSLIERDRVALNSTVNIHAKAPSYFTITGLKHAPSLDIAIEVLFETKGWCLAGIILGRDAAAAR
jgi:hypothetical protein